MVVAAAVAVVFVVAEVLMVLLMTFSLWENCHYWQDMCCNLSSRCIFFVHVKIVPSA